MMTDYSNQELSKYELLVSSYETFVGSLSDGYDMCIYEYTNDMSCRQILEEARLKPALVGLWSRVEVADSQLKNLLKPTKCCIHGTYPKESFWYWGYPPNSPELESDLREMEAL
jgi:hypothetical protein